MSIKKFDPKALNAWIDRLIAKEKVIGVQADGERFAFGPLDRAEDLRLDYDVTKLPPKKYFLPQKETLMTFDKGGAFKGVIESEPFVLLGVHPYDMVAINQMDAIFSRDNGDPNYLTRRQSAVIVACDPQNASHHTFAGSMGTATVDEGFDVLLSKVGEVYLADARTEKGEALLAEAAEAVEPAETDLARREQLWEDNSKLLSKHDLDCSPSEIPALLEQSYNSPRWEEKAERCFSCGSCNLVCPTCYCFDVQDDVNWDIASGKRERSWDGCLLSEFAIVAGNHNFRPNRADRYRHRFYRKGKYLMDRMGQIACVGCGRCVTACVPDIANPVTIYNQLLEDQQ